MVIIKILAVSAAYINLARAIVYRPGERDTEAAWALMWAVMMLLLV